MTDSKASYSEFCHRTYVPMHLQPWWLDAVCSPNGWKVALATDKGGAILGVLPYQVRRRWGFPVIQLPALTTYAGPWLNYPQVPDFKAISRVSFEHRVMADLIRQLPRVFLFKQNFRPEVTNWLPFYWEGFHQTTRYTYRLEAPFDLEKITAGFKNTLRSDLKKAKLATVIHREDQAWATVFALNKRAYERKSHSQPYTLETFAQLHSRLETRGQCACFIALDRHSGEPSAGLYLAFDQQQAAVLLTGTEPALKGQCAVYGLFWEAILFCSERSLSLDFEGSMDMGIERAFRAFGALLTPYFQVWKWLPQRPK